MSTQTQIRRGSASNVGSFTGSVGELVMDTTNNILYLMDGTTTGGHLVGGYTAGTNVTITGNVISATGGGGTAWLTANNGNQFGTPSVATGTDSICCGDGSSATGANSIVLGAGITDSGYSNCLIVTLNNGTGSVSGTAAVVLGTGSAGASSLAIGAGNGSGGTANPHSIVITAPPNTFTGATTETTGVDAILLGAGMNVPTNAIGIGFNDFPSLLVLGTQAVHIGYNSGTGGATGDYSICINGRFASGANSTAIGGSSLASQDESLALNGAYADGIGVNAIGQNAYGTHVSSLVVGDNQAGPPPNYISGRTWNALYGQTTNNTPQLLTDGNGGPGSILAGTGSGWFSTIQVDLMGFDTTGVAYVNYKIYFTFNNNLGVGSGVFGPQTVIWSDILGTGSTWAYSITFDNVNNTVQIQVTGDSTLTVNWKAKVIIDGE